MIERKIVARGLALGLMVGNVGLAMADEYATSSSMLPPPPPGQSAPLPMQHGDPVANAQRHLEDFRRELGVTDAQAAAWHRYATETLDAVRSIRDKGAEAQAQQPSASQHAPQRFDEHIALMRQRLESFEKMDQALKTFYATLTPDQQAIADRHFARLRH